MTEQQGVEGAGHRVRSVRKLAGLTQEQLAQRAHVSVSLVRKVETAKVPASPFFVASVARALQVSVPELYDQPQPRFGSERAGVAELEIAIMSGPVLATDGPIPAVDVLAARVEDLMKARKRAQYKRLAIELPALLADAHAATESLTGDAQRRAWAVLAEAHLHATVTLYRLGSDVAGQAADTGVRAAERADNPALASVIAVDGCLPLMLRGAYNTVEAITDRARALMSGYTDDVDTRSAHGHAHLRAAIVSARTGSTDRSAEHLDAARRLAEQLPNAGRTRDTSASSPIDILVSFSRDNVTLHAVAAAVEAGDGTEALSRRAPLGKGLTPSRLAHHHIDLSRAHLLAGNRDETLSELNNARETAPQLVRYHPQVQETVRVLAETDRRRSDSLSGFAKWAGIVV